MLASKAVKAPAASKTTSAKYTIVSRRSNTSTTTPLQAASYNAARRKSLVKQTNMARALQLQKQQTISFYQQLARQRQVQQAYLKQQNALLALKATSRQSQQMHTGAQARRQAVKRAFRQYGVSSYARGSLIRTGRYTAASARNTLTLSQAIAATKSKNSSAAARAAQSLKASNRNRARFGAKTVVVSTYVSTPTVRTPKAIQIKSVRQRPSQGRKGKAPLQSTAKPKASCFLGEQVLTRESPWVTAGNDAGVDNCLAVALANHLLYTTGTRLTDAQVASVAAAGTTISETVAALQAGLIAGIRPDDLVYECSSPGTICIFDTPDGTHAVLRLPRGRVVSWGQELYPVNRHKWFFKEAWSVNWLVS